MLTGIRIIDFSKYLPGPYATMRLADKGAEVIVVEPIEGESSRHLGLKKDGTGLIYLANNRNKRSIAVNLKHKEGKQIALELIKTADIVVESFRPDVMEKLGLDYKSVRKLKEDIIYCSISGYGQLGRLASLGSHDLNYLAIGGVLSQLKDDKGKPVIPTVQLADHLGAFQCTEGILAAIVKRNQTKQGSYIDLSLVDPLLSIMGTNFMYYEEKNEPNGVPDLTGQLFCYSLYETNDNRYIVLAALEAKFWSNFCLAVGKEEWLPFHLKRKNEYPEFCVEITEFFKNKGLYEWTDFALRVDCCMSPVLEIGEISRFPFLEERNLIDKQHVASYFLQNLADVSSPPDLGSDSKQVLSSILGYTNEKIDHLSKNHIVKT